MTKTRSNKANGFILAVAASTILVAMFLPLQSYQLTNCISAYGQSCYATNEMYFSATAKGAKVTQKVPFPSNIYGTIVSPLWVKGTDLQLYEIGWWADQTITQPKWYIGLNGAPVGLRWCTNNICPSNGSTHIFQISDYNNDDIWILMVGTDTKNISNPNSSNVLYLMEAGYEMGYQDTNPGVNDYSSISYINTNGQYVLFSSSAGTKSASIVPDVTAYTVDFCNDSPWTHFKNAKPGGQNLC